MVAGRLLAPDLFSDWGIRTLSTAHPSFNPLSYHLGSIWPFANAMVASGLGRYGFGSAAQAVAGAMFRSSQTFACDRLPEVFGGTARDERHPHPILYPGACWPQAWSSSAVISLVQTMLGLTPLGAGEGIRLAPDLPEWLPSINLQGLSVGRGSVDFRVTRLAEGEAAVEVLRSDDHVRVVVADAPHRMVLMPAVNDQRHPDEG